ncbi:hypothetical protein DFO58_2223 [Arthrobacter sp. AG1021]|nr:hypothetical protein DFO58_2223 [Arthrobacter sp. AG1021]
MYCTFAAALNKTGLTDQPITSRAMAKELAEHGHLIGKSTINYHRAGTCKCTNPAAVDDRPAPAAPRAESGKVDVGPDGGEFTEIKTSEPLTDWTHIFERFNLDPEQFTIVDDTVRMSMWQQSKGLEDGTRDIVNLYSYRAKFTRKKQGMIDYATLRDQIRNWAPTPASTTPSRPPVTYVIGMADWQLGKGEGDGTPGTLRRLNASLEAITRDLDQLAAQGIRPEGVLFANLGDHTENVAGSYASQTHTVDLNMRDQLNLALEQNLAWLKALAPRFKTATYAACMCNHGQLSRGNGRDNVTDDADNATGLIGDTLATLCKLHPELEHIEFNIPRDEMITTTTVSGVNMAMAHGHKISGAEETWLAKQSQNLVHTRRFIPDLWFTAHRHSAAVNDYGPYTRIQATTVDPGSKWFTDSTGAYSRPGTTTFLVGADLPGMWDHYRIH